MRLLFQRRAFGTLERREPIYEEADGIEAGTFAPAGRAM
jgi:hypothetical protein